MTPEGRSSCGGTSGEIIPIIFPMRTEQDGRASVPPACLPLSQRVPWT